MHYNADFVSTGWKHEIAQIEILLYVLMVLPGSSNPATLSPQLPSSLNC